MKRSPVCGNLGLTVSAPPPPVADETVPTRSQRVRIETATTTSTDSPLRTLPRVQPLQRPLKLPKSTEEWVEADQLLVQVAPSVAECSSVEEKSRVLSELRVEF